MNDASQGNVALQAPRPVTPAGILAQKLERLVSRADGMTAIDPTFKEELRSAARLSLGLEPYVDACTTQESPALASLTQRTQQEDWSKCFSSGETVHALEQEMLSGHAEGQFLKLLVRSIQAKQVLEIGMFTGYAALAMAEALPDDGQVVACELDGYVARFAQDCFDQSPHGHKIQVKVGAATETLQDLSQTSATFDFVFIDANKDGYVDYFHALLESGLLAENGLICVDNTLMQGQPYLDCVSTSNGDAIAHFNKVVADDPRVHQVLLPLRDGVTLIRRA